MAKSVDEQIKILDEKITKLEEQKKAIEAKITEAKGKRNVLEKKVDLGYLESIKALGLSMDDLMNLAKEKAKSVSEAGNLNNNINGTNQNMGNAGINENQNRY